MIQQPGLPEAGLLAFSGTPVRRARTLVSDSR